MKLITIGNSHVIAVGVGLRNYIQKHPGLADGVETRSMGSQRFHCEPFFDVHGKTIKLDVPDLKWSELRPGPDEAYVVVLGFHTVHFLWITNTFCPLEHAASERFAISDATLLALIHSKQKFQKQFLLAMRNAGANLVVVESPYIFRDSKHGQSGNQNAVLHVDRMVREDMAAFLAENNLPLVRIPAHMIEGGYMKPVYRSTVEGDQHHANSRMGEELAPAILESAGCLMPA